MIVPFEVLGVAGTLYVVVGARLVTVDPTVPDGAYMLVLADGAKVTGAPAAGATALGEQHDGAGVAYVCTAGYAATVAVGAQPVAHGA
jgi:hypothetical protein